MYKVPISKKQAIKFITEDLVKGMSKVELKVEYIEAITNGGKPLVRWTNKQLKELLETIHNIPVIIK